MTLDWPPSEPGIVLALMFSLAYLIVSLGEVSYRYCGWVLELYSGHERTVLRQQIFGSALHSFAFGCLCVIALTAPLPSPGGWRFGMWVGFDYIAAIAATLKLVSYWMMRGYSDGDIAIAIINRIAVALIAMLVWAIVT